MKNNCFLFIKSRIRQISCVAGKACCFAADLSRLRNLFRFIMSRIRQICRVAGKACCFAADLSRLRNLFRFIMSRIRQICHVAIPAPVGGFGLVETLTVTGLSLAFGMGVLKLTQVSVRAAQIESTAFAEANLLAEVTKLLKNPRECAFNLKPSRLSDKANKKGTLKDKKLIKTKGNNLVVHNHTSDDVVILESGKSYGDGLIKIQKMALIDPDESNSNTAERDFIVYYSKPMLGAHKTIGGKTCTDGTGATDQAGCYTISYEIDYHCKDVDGDCLEPADHATSPPAKADKCAFLKYKIGEEDVVDLSPLFGTGCEDNEYFRGVKPNGDLDCVSTTCPKQQLYYKLGGVLNSGGIQSSCLDLSPCPSGKILRTYGSNGKIMRVCDLSSLDNIMGRNCPAGWYLRGYHSSGILCAPLCIGGSYYNGSGCRCPSRRISRYRFRGQYLVNDQCQQCPANMPYYDSNGNCSRCTAPTPHYHNGSCHRCRSSYYYNNTCNNRCQRGTPHYYNGTCNRCPSSTPHYYNSRCNRCQEGQYYYNSRCNRCSSNTPHYYSSRCNRCQENTHWTGSVCLGCSGGLVYNSARKTCVCPANETEVSRNGHNVTCCPNSHPHYYSNSCNRCSAGTPHYYNSRCNRCSSNTPHYYSGRCNICPSSRPHHYGGNKCSKCPRNQGYISTDNGNTCVKCTSEKRYWTGTRCATSCGNSMGSLGLSGGITNICFSISETTRVLFFY